MGLTGGPFTVPSTIPEQQQRHVKRARAVEFCQKHPLPSSELNPADDDVQRGCGAEAVTARER
jgi:hypothetical protein